jgi:hypothetical protein
MTTQQIIGNGTTGITASVFSIITTFQEQLEWWIRISGATVGLIIAAVTLYRLITHPLKK